MIRGTGVAISRVVHLASHTTSESPERSYRVRVLGPDCDPLSVADLQRLFPGEVLTPARRQRLRDGSRIVIACGDRVVAAGVYQFTECELRISDVAVDSCEGCDLDDVFDVLLESCELACLAAGCRRVLVIAPPAASLARLRKRGYEIVSEGCGGSWIEKRF
jgi:hypothetical protein